MKVLWEIRMLEHNICDCFDYKVSCTEATHMLQNRACSIARFYDTAFRKFFSKDKLVGDLHNVV